MLEKPVRVEFIKKLHLFYGLNDNDLAAVAEELQERTFDKDGPIFAAGAPADALHIIYNGRVELASAVKDKPVRVTALSRGDYYGEQGLLRGRTRDANATAEAGTVLLILTRMALARLLKNIPGLRQNFELMLSSRQLARQLDYDWLMDNEVIYFLGRKHQVLLVIAMLWPAAFFLPLFGLLGLAFAFSSATLGLVGGFLFVANLAWMVWRIVDWGNDYYIVTTQRVIWLEKVVGFYDSRTEAGMSNILAVNFDTEYLGRIFNYGTVVVRTYTGQIRMNYVRHPKKVVALIEEFLARSKDLKRRADEETMKQAIRNRLGISKPGALPAQDSSAPATSAAQPQAAKPVKPVKKSSALTEWWTNLFRMRTEDGNVITYHKHIFGLFRDTFYYNLGIGGLVIFTLIWPWILNFAMPLWVGVLLVTAVLVLFATDVYQYLDWQNDIYQVTPEQIIDVSRKPFGTEDRKSAPLENILSTENKRNGLMGVLFNFGTVYIMVGTTEFNFDDVADPPSVQQDIIRRQQGLLLKKKEKENAAERDRMTEWLAMYHRTMDEVNREKDQNRPPKQE